MPDERPPGAREAMLRRIRDINGASLAETAVAQEWSALPRTYRESGADDESAKLHCLTERLLDYDATVYRVRSGEVASSAQAILQSLGLAEVLVPQGLEPQWRPSGVACVEDRNFAPAELDRFAAVLTGCTLAIAETGTLVLQSVAGQGRRAATLVPDVHLCVLRAGDVVWSVPEAIRRLQVTATLPTTFVSGPSATADIEMTRIKGVHGPRFLHVLLTHT